MKPSAIALIVAAIIISSASAAPDTERQCSANDSHSDGLVSYAESREQRLALASMNQINPGQNGSIAVHGWNQSDVLVKACLRTAAESDADARALASQVAIVRGPGSIEPDGPASTHRRQWNLSYEIWVPSQANLSLEAHNGSLKIDTVHGQIRFHTVNGSVHLAQLGGDVDGATTNGSVTITLTGNRWEGNGLRMETTNGSVRLNVPANYSAQIEASTVNGGMHVDFPITMSGNIGKTLAFQLGGGGATIQAKTVNGAVHIARQS
jgi:putative adhesin